MEGMEGMKLQQLMERQPKRKVRTSSYLIDEDKSSAESFCVKDGTAYSEKRKSVEMEHRKVRTLSPAESGGRASTENAEKHALQKSQSFLFENKTVQDFIVDNTEEFFKDFNVTLEPLRAA